MTNISVLENKISSVRKYLKTLSRYEGYSQSEIEDDETLKGAVERYLYLAAQSVIDLAEAVIAFRDFRKPSTFSESFSILAEEGLLPDELTLKMKRLAGFRNIMAHDYEKIDYAIVLDVLKNRLPDIEEFLSIVQAKVVNR